MGWRFIMRQQRVQTVARARAAPWNQPKSLIRNWKIVKGLSFLCCLTPTFAVWRLVSAVGRLLSGICYVCNHL
jgi:hypothetical protein